MDDFITQVIHGEAKAGKTRYATTGPGRTLVLDSEAGGMRFVPGDKVVWDVDSGMPPPGPGDWRICRVPVRGVMTYNRVRDYLLEQGERHPFNNIAVDSLTESQDMIKKERSPTFQLEQSDWGIVFGMMNDIVVTFRDIVDATPHMKSLTVITGTAFKDGMFRPLLSGQFQRKLGYKLDLIGFLLKTRDQKGDLRRGLILGESDQHEVGHRLGENAPEVLWDPTITKLLNAVFGTDYEEVIK